MRQEIIRTLEKIEKEADVKILYAVESGSRAWGFPSQDSDYDVRFIYVHKPEWYLSVMPGRDVLEYPINDLLDINGWDVKKALQLLKKGNPTLIEWLSSSIVYKEAGKITSRMRTLVVDYYPQKVLMLHYYHMAKGNFTAYLKTNEVKIKKYFYVLRPILACRYIETYQQIPPILFTDLLKQQVIPDTVKKEIKQLLKRKIVGDEFDIEAKNNILNEYIEAELLYFETALQEVEDNIKIPDEVLNQVFLQTIDYTKL